MFENTTEKIVDFGNFEISQLGDAAALGGTMVLIGMLTVFAVLCMLWGCLVLFKIFFHDLPEKKSSNATEPVITENISAKQAVSSAEDEIVAVVAAAIAMAESESGDTKFRVVSFKRK